MSSCFVSASNPETVLKTYKKNGGTKSLDIVKVRNLPDSMPPVLIQWRERCWTSLICRGETCAGGVEM